HGVSVFNVDSAFCNIPTHPEDWPLLAVLIDGLVVLDLCLNFGGASSPVVFGQVTNAIVRIYLHKGVDTILKWVDDFIFFPYPKPSANGGPPSFSYDDSLIWSVAANLGWLWAHKKFRPFEWLLDDKTVELLLLKRKRYLAKLEPWISGASVSLKDLESVIGTLNHICLVIPAGQEHMPSLFTLQASFPADSTSWIRH
ncbi:hypothetical protein DXG01_005615, partial [Tephrocybe rancida]